MGLIEIKNVDFSSSELTDYIEQVLLIVPSVDTPAVKFVHMPQLNELLVLNVDTTLEEPSAGTDVRANMNYICGKSDRKTVYHTLLSDIVCMVRFKPYALYAFAKNDVERYKNRVIKLSCSIGGSLEHYVAEGLETDLLNGFCRKKAGETAYRVTSEIVAYIDSAPYSVTVTELAGRFGLSLATLRRYFKKYIGVNVYGYIRYVKVRNMLKRMYGDEYNTMAVQECGFYDQSHFIKEFKKIYGMPPRRFMASLGKIFREDKTSEKLFEACFLEV